MLESTIAAFIANVLADLTKGVVEVATRKWQRILKGDEEYQAFERCLSGGLLAMLGQASGATTIQLDQLEDIFDEFFEQPAVRYEIAKLLRGKSLNQEELAEIFYDLEDAATTLPRLDFEQAIRFFEVGFLAAASQEPLFQQRIQTAQLIEQTGIQRALLAKIDQLVTTLRQVGYNHVQIGAGVVTITHPQLGAQQFLLAAPPDDRLDGERKAYLEYTLKRLRKIDLKGIDREEASDSKAQLQLDGLYTALLTLSSEQHKPLSALAQLNQHSHLVLMGDPGSGKSTFVNYVGLCLAGEALGDEQVNLDSLTAPLPKRDGEDEEERQPWRHGALLPVRVVLRDFAARGLPAASERITAECLWEFIESELREAKREAFVPDLQNALRDGDAILLLDGLDEVPEANRRREQIKEAIIRFTESFPCRVLVTSRTYAYKNPKWKLPDFEEAVLAPFSEGQIRRFVTSWYAHLATRKHLNAQNAQGRARLLQEAIDRNERLQELAERPLLLTLMASLHAWHGRHLPEKREELYHDAVVLLFYRWEDQRFVINKRGEQERQPSFAELLKVGEEKVRKVLNKLAYEAHKSQPKMVGTADIPQKELISGLWAISDNPDIKQRRLVEYLEHRAGLLLERSEGVYTFPHRTFQEYLAACHLADRNPADMAKLARQEPNRWREVALLAAAKIAGGSDWQVWSCVDPLCHTDVEKTKEPLADAWGALLAGQLLVESADLSDVDEAHQPKVERVREWQLHILRGDTLPAIERVLAGNTLAVLGDPRFRADKWYLPDADEEPLGFVEVPEGPFTMGSAKEHEVTLPTYWIARYPVTVAQWRAFVEAAKHKPVDADSLKGIANHPVRSVSWHEAMAYCQWLEEKLRKEAEERLVKGAPPAEREFWDELWSSKKVRVTLPSEAEWEKAARGVLTQEGSRTYPWGEEADPERANYDETGIGGPSPVGAFARGASFYGCEEMSGNVWEWTRPVWGDEGEKVEAEYAHNPKDGAEDMPHNTAKAIRVRRGGSFASDEGLVRCTARDLNGALGEVGWRVVVSRYTPNL